MTFPYSGWRQVPLDRNILANPAADEYLDGTASFVVAQMGRGEQDGTSPLDVYRFDLPCDPLRDDCSKSVILSQADLVDGFGSRSWVSELHAVSTTGDVVLVTVAHEGPRDVGYKYELFRYDVSNKSFLSPLD